jgi:nicotinate phosphoribosyltransferase
MNSSLLAGGESLALLTDLYQLTMASGYWKAGLENLETTFHLYFRENPFGGGYTITAGLSQAIEYLKNLRFTTSDLDYLASLKSSEGNPVFESEFLKVLEEMEFCVDLDAIPEGRMVFPQEPLIRVQGPVIQCQLLESPLLNLINFPTLIATKATRVCQAALGDSVLEFGLRRAQGVGAALVASRSAYIGGCAATSNLLAGKLLGIPVRGTHAHSWVMCFEDETESFKEFARTMPDHTVFLVDTYDTLAGVRKAIEVGDWLRARGQKMLGVRLDSGDLAYLSVETRKLLDEAGFEDARIYASNELDESIIESLKLQGAKIAVWGVGTRLVTGHGQPSLGGVYKLTALRRAGEKTWQPKIKLSEQAVKMSNPGVMQVRRFYSRNEAKADMIFDVGTDLSRGCTLIDPLDMTRQKKIRSGMKYEDLLVPVLRSGSLVYEEPELEAIRELVGVELSRFHAGVKRFVNPHKFPVGIEKGLHTCKTELILKARDQAHQGTGGFYDNP